MGSQKSWTQLSDKLFHFHFYLIVDKSLVQKYSWSLNPLIQTTLGKEKFFLFFFLPHHLGCRIFIPQPGIKPMLSAVEVQSLDHGTAKEVWRITFLIEDLEYTPGYLLFSPFLTPLQRYPWRVYIFATYTLTFAGIGPHGEVCVQMCLWLG